MVEFFSVAMFVISCREIVNIGPLSLNGANTTFVDQFLFADNFYFSTNSKFALKFVEMLACSLKIAMV